MADVETIASPLTPGQTRVIDPILSTIALGYANAEFVGDALFPYVPVNISGGQVLQFGKEAFRSYNTARAPGARTGRISFGYFGKKFALAEDAIDVPVPREMLRDAGLVPGIDLGIRATNLGMRVITLALERKQAAIALDTGNYDASLQVALSGSSKWSSTVDPVPQINSYREAVRASIGRYPNVLLLGAVSFTALQNNTNLRQHFQFTSSQSIMPDMIARYFGLDKVVVGAAVTSDDNDVLSDVWGNNAVLAYVPGTDRAQEVPSYGYTYRMIGQPMVEMPRWDGDTKSWIYGVAQESDPQFTGNWAGFLIQNPA